MVIRVAARLYSSSIGAERALERTVERLSSRARIIAGTTALLAISWIAMGLDLWSFERLPEHRFASMAMLTGTLRLRSALSTVGPDEQVYNGAGYTNWSFGVPILQAPLHALARAVGMAGGFFPDRAIYFAYFTLMVPLLWAAFDRLLILRGGHWIERSPRRQLLSWSATLLVLTCTLFPLMSDRFLIYEETLCYWMVFELLALAAYVFAQPTWHWRRVALIAAPAGIGLLVRPTGLIMMGVWGTIVAVEARPRWRSIAVFTTVAAPFVAFWMWTNCVRSGSPFALGLSNALPYYSYSVLEQRFGSTCVDTPWHFLQATARVFEGFFFVASDDSSPWMRRCHLTFERRPADGWLYPNEGFLGPVVFALLVLIALHALREHGGKRISRLVPIGALAVLIVGYARGTTVAWRYAGDFWPLIVLACVQTVRTGWAGAERLFAPPLSIAVLALAILTFARHVPSTLGGLEIVHTRDAAGMWEEFARTRWATDAPMATRLECGDRLPDLYESGYGWTPFCEVGEVTNVYLGVPDGVGDERVLRFDAPGATAPTLRVSVNGRIYSALRAGETYAARVRIRRQELFTPVVMVTIEWTRQGETPWSVGLRSIELS
jgi:hypothetical protein